MDKSVKYIILVCDTVENRNWNKSVVTNTISVHDNTLNF